METTEGLLAAWRAAETAVEAAEPGTTEWREARRHAEAAKAAYLGHVDEMLDVAGHRHDEDGPRGARDRTRDGKPG